MVSNMKTTVEISDALLEEAKRVAAREGVTLRLLVEEGLRNALAARKTEKAFQLRDARSPGRLRPEFEGNWPAIRDEIYRGRGT